MDTMEQLLGFSSFGKRKRSNQTPPKDRPKAVKVDYVAEQIDFLQAHSHLTLDELATTFDTTTTPSTESTTSTDLFPLLIEALESVLDAKTRLHDARLSAGAYREARALANPWEALGRWKFVNRSAMKMAELDARLHLTKSIGTRDLSFVDLCGAPGGFSEYLVFRANYEHVRGYGISIRVRGSSHLDWQLPPSMHDLVSISFGADDTGDLYRQENMDHFVQSVPYFDDMQPVSTWSWPMEVFKMLETTQTK
ncbi:hypothetical protein DYB25_005753 [Aphanomyces astaci]|uniref:Cap-specific mRNA (nucleoside-2'-O-)-methyltransferase 1 n=1 Tax=Aphanomyces astaci TaxID=112090 RepID=A0A397BAY6_APHAT|nr:hypothetical protein DYB25_005753 [Aphanomyces astaci]